MTALIGVLVAALAFYGLVTAVAQCMVALLVLDARTQNAERRDEDAVASAVIDRWAKREESRRARSMANRALLARVTDEDRVEIAALIRDSQRAA